MPVGFLSVSTPNINEASRTDLTASVHRNVLSLAVWRGPEEKESLSFGEITQSANLSLQSGSSRFQDCKCAGCGEKKPKDCVSSSRPPAPARREKVPLNLPETWGRRAASSLAGKMRVSLCSADVCKQNRSGDVVSDRACSTADGRDVGDQERRKVQLEERRRGSTEGKGQDVISGSPTILSSHPRCRACVHREVPLRSSSSAVFLDKSLFISLADLDGRQTSQPTLYTSTLSVRVGASSCCRSSADNKRAKTNEGYQRPRAAMLGTDKRNGRGSSLGHGRGLLIKQRCCKVEQMAPARGVNSEPDDSGTQRHSSTLGLLSFRGPSPSNTKAGRQKGNADEAAFPTRRNFTHRQHTFNIGPVECRTWGERAARDGAQGGGEEKHAEAHGVDDEAPKILSLKEALELFRPDFISRSQSRVRRLEQRAMRRRAAWDSNPDLVRGLREDRGRQRRNCTTADPLSDNLFKPRERSISGREMQLRSRRIYNKLPEVTKKKEEEKKRAVSQTNRLRAEVFKKKLLDQILQR